MLNFFKQDFLISSLAIFGFLIMFKSKKYRALSIFCLISIVLMEIVYFKINPSMTRYTTHTLPFLLIPAGYFLTKIPQTKFFYSILILLIIIQSFFSFNGIKKWDKGDWTRPSYEEKSAIALKDYVKDTDVMIASFPEPYYYFNHKTVLGVKNEIPFVDFSELDENQDLLIVNDLGMQDIFPNFYNFVSSNLENNKIGHYFVFTNYRYKTYYRSETLPVNVYRIKLWVLKDLVASQTNP